MYATKPQTPEELRVHIENACNDIPLATIQLDHDAVVKAIDKYKKYYTFKKLMEVDYVVKDKAMQEEEEMLRKDKRDYTGLAEDDLSKLYLKELHCGKRIQVTKKPTTVEKSNFTYAISDYWFLQELVLQVIPPYFYTVSMLLLVIIAVKLKTWLGKYKKKSPDECELFYMDNIFKVVENIQAEHKKMKSVMEKYAIEGNDKMRYVLLKVISHQEQMHVTSKEYEENVVFRFNQCSRVTVKKVAKLAVELKLERRISRRRRIAINKKISQMRNQVKDLKMVDQEDMADVVPGSTYRWHLSAEAVHIQKQQGLQ
ncbi:uncharacterized protein [Periplaneta americana]|uniref:uncharacterized protein n=1 Tax=Periplaneta americana TaxID=6978 RepID=UPI0037E7353A